DASIKSKYFKNDMLPFFNGKIIVRKNVAKMLADINLQLREKGLGLTVAYGLRLLEIQKKYFSERYLAVKLENPELNEDELREKTHSMSASPDVAGHPTGGAVDLSLYNLESGENLDMGGRIADFSDKRIETFSDGLSEAQKENRKILHDAMIEVGFCPFYGEWWHFCYGDREWAFFYDKQCAIYNQVDLKDVVIE
ncbi:MAG: M15 family metallopeptidase, partial [Candidatus Magasanikbacteria bacterium]|nr:M15 family metallopeptidase [Candidatus Magasanikbacteria bacterium]